LGAIEAMVNCFREFGWGGCLTIHASATSAKKRKVNNVFHAEFASWEIVRLISWADGLFYGEKPKAAVMWNRL
jgi:hypothetical protein